jgi:hypothetical protein
MSQPQCRSWLPRTWVRRFFERREAIAPRPVARPRLEALEDRSVPAVHVFARGSTLYIEGDKASNTVALVQEGHEVRVTADTARTQTFAGITSVVADLGAGNDRMTVAAAPLPTYGNNPQAALFAVSVGLGAGDDQFTGNVVPPDTEIPTNCSISLNVEGGNGRDTVEITASGRTGNGAAMDLLVLNEFSISVEGGTGGDEVGIIIINSKVGTLNQIVNLGEGNDSLSFESDLTVTGEMFMRTDGGAGDDMVSSDVMVRAGTPVGSNMPSVAMFDAAIDGGEGNNHITVSHHIGGGFPQPTDRFGDVKNKVSAPGGNDSIWIDISAPMVGNFDFLVMSGAGHDDVFVNLSDVDAEEANVAILTAAGNDDLEFMMRQVRFTIDESFVVDTAAGNDKLRVFSDGLQTFRNLQAMGDMQDRLRSVPTIFRTGPGNDYFDGRLMGVKLGTGFMADSGEGDDEFNLMMDDASIDGTFVANTGGGVNRARYFLSDVDHNYEVLGNPVLTNEFGPFSTMSDNGRDTVSGYAQKVRFGTGFLANTGAGNDQVEWAFTDAQSFGSQPLTVLTGDGDDSLTFRGENLTSEGGTLLDTGDGDDIAFVEQSRSEHSYHDLAAAVLLGDGFDFLNYSGRQLKINDGGLLIDAAAGNDVVIADFSDVEFGDEAGLPTVRSGNGGDFLGVTMQKVKLGKPGFLQDAGAGNDLVVMRISDALGTGDFRVLTGEGNDLLAGQIDHAGNAALGVFVNLGGGNDVSVLNFGYAPPPRVFGQQPTSGLMNISVFGGGGDDIIDVNVRLFPPVVGGGWFFPTTIVPGAPFRLNLLVDGGGGNDILSAAIQFTPPYLLVAGPVYTGEVHVDMFGGSGNDYLSFFVFSLPVSSTVQFFRFADGGPGIDAAQGFGGSEVNTEF